MNRRTIANMITFVLVGGLFFFWASTRLVNVSAIKHPYTLQAEFSNAVQSQLLPAAVTLTLPLGAKLVGR